MTTSELRRRAKQRLERLSPRRLVVADDFLAYLEALDLDEATEELLSIPGFVSEFERARDEAVSGDVTPVDALKRRT